MIAAVAEEYLSKGCHVTVPVGSELRAVAREKLPHSVHIVARETTENPHSFMNRLVARYDAIWLIAPETGRVLATWTRWAARSGIELLSCPSRHVELFSSKSATCDWLNEHGIPTPIGIVVPGSNDFKPILAHAVEAGLVRTDSALVVKPDDGVGGENARLFHDLEQAEAFLQTQIAAGRAPGLEVRPWRIEPYHPGTPVSCGIEFEGRAARILPATRQVLEPHDVGAYRYSYPIPDAELQSRAQRLAAHVAKHLVHARGYYGVDIVLGTSAVDDVVIEINPRMSASCSLARQLRNAPAEDLPVHP